MVAEVPTLLLLYNWNIKALRLVIDGPRRQTNKAADVKVKSDLATQEEVNIFGRVFLAVQDLVGVDLDRAEPRDYFLQELPVLIFEEHYFLDRCVEGKLLHLLPDARRQVLLEFLLLFHI